MRPITLRTHSTGPLSWIQDCFLSPGCQDLDPEVGEVRGERAWAPEGQDWVSKALTKHSTLVRGWGFSYVLVSSFIERVGYSKL